MAEVIIDLTMSLDGFIAGPNDSIEQPLGGRGQRLFDWVQSGELVSTSGLGGRL